MKAAWQLSMHDGDDFFSNHDRGRFRQLLLQGLLDQLFAFSI